MWITACIPFICREKMEKRLGKARGMNVGITALPCDFAFERFHRIFPGAVLLHHFADF